MKPFKFVLASVIAAGMLTSARPGLADDIDQLANLAQAEFERLSEDLSSALSYKAIIPATPLGWTGFDIGFELTATDLHNPTSWTTPARTISPAPSCCPSFTCIRVYRLVSMWAPLSAQRRVPVSN